MQTKSSVNDRRKINQSTNLPIGDVSDHQGRALLLAGANLLHADNTRLVASATAVASPSLSLLVTDCSRVPVVTTSLVLSLVSIRVGSMKVTIATALPPIVEISNATIPRNVANLHPLTRRRVELQPLG